MASLEFGDKTYCFHIVNGFRNPFQGGLGITPDFVGVFREMVGDLGRNLIRRPAFKQALPKIVVVGVARKLDCSFGFGLLQWNTGNLVEAIGIPDLLSQMEIECAALIEVGLFEVRVRFERETGVLE